MIADWTLTLSDGVNPIAFDVLAQVQDADYSWSAEAILRRQTDGALFFVTDGGCSCYSFGEYLTVADLTPIQRPEDALALTSDRENLEKSIRSSEAVYR